MIDVNDYLCTSSTCFGKINGAWTYHDNSHITASMARQLWQYYAPAVADVVPGMVAARCPVTAVTVVANRWIPRTRLPDPALLPLTRRSDLRS